MEDEWWPAGQVKREKAVATDGKGEEDNVLNTSLTPPIPLLPSSFPSFHLLPLRSFPPNCPTLSLSSPPSLFTHQTPAICWMDTGKIHLSSTAHSTWSEITHWQKNYSKTLSKLTCHSTGALVNIKCGIVILRYQSAWKLSNSLDTLMSSSHYTNSASLAQWAVVQWQWHITVTARYCDSELSSYYFVKPFCTSSQNKALEKVIK